MSLQVNDLPAGAALRWLKQGALLIRKAPFAWLMLSSGYFCFSFSLSLAAALVPVLGTVCLLLLPVFGAGLFLAAQHQAKEQSAPPQALLFAGFKLKWRPLLIIGSLRMMVEMAVMLGFTLIWFSDFRQILPSTPPETEAAQRQLADAILLYASTHLVSISLLMLSLVAVALISVFAVPLATLRQLPGGHALRWGIYAAIANALPLAIYAGCMLVLFLISSLPGNINLGLLSFLLLFALIALHHAAMYVAYSEIFSDPAMDTAAA